MSALPKIILIVVLLLSCCHKISFTQTQRNPVLEEVTGTWCQWCPCGHNVMASIKADMPNAIMIGYHGPANGSDPFSYFSGNAIISTFGFSGYPTAVIDRVSGIQSRSAWAGLMNVRKNDPATVSINVSRTFNTTTREFISTIDFTALENLNGQYKFNVILLENGIVWSQSGNTSCTGGSNYVHNHVVRDMMNGALGEEIINGAWNENDVVTKTLNHTIPHPGGTGPDMVWENCSVVILVYKVGSPLSSNAEIQQAVEMPLINPLVAYYPFNGNANDESGNGYNGIVYGANLTTDRFGNTNSAYIFNGGDDYIEIPGTESVDIDDAITISTWVKLDDLTAGNNIVTKWLPFQKSFVLYENEFSDNFQFVLFADGDVIFIELSSNTPAVVGEWTHIAATYDGNQAIIYYNGQPDGTQIASGVIHQGGSDIEIGRDNFFNHPLDGMIDDIRIYNYALDGNEIQQLYQEGGWDLTTWQTELLVVDAADGSQVLTLGQDPAATDSLDTGLGESDLPPPPPPGAIDARFNFPTNPPIQSLVDFRNDSVQAIDWEITFQGTYPLDFCWIPDSLPYGTFYLVDGLGGLIVNVDMKIDSCVTVTNPAISKLYIKYGRQNNVIVNVDSGWNIISAPILKSDMYKDRYYPGNTSDVFTFYPDSGYVIRDSLELARGYWLKFPNDTSYSVTGLNHRFRIDLEGGWNIVGPFDFLVPVSSITSIPTGIISSNFYGYDEGYLIADTLQPGKGYWVKASANGKVILDPSILVKGEENQFASLMDQWGKIFIEDAVGDKMVLYITEDDINVELPPMPPSGIFDARFTTDNMVENIAEESKRIKLSSASYPITIRVESLNMKVNDIISGDIINEELHSGDRLVISDPNINILKISSDFTEGIPVSYELYQNYPNPFNPSTVIKFALPQDSKVNLTVFNILGEEIVELVNQEMKGGYHQIEFDASRYASGVYLYSITAGDFFETKKMVILR